MLRQFARLLIMGLGLIALGNAIGFAQSGQILGHVTDQQGAVIPGATVQIVNQDRNFEREAKTDNQGTYSAPYLPPGKYQVSVQKEGFSSGNRVLQLSVGQAFVLDIQMTIASANAEVTVEAGESNRIEMESSSMATTLSNQEVAGYALNGRNFSQLITMAPGVSNQTGQDEAKVGVAGSAKFSVNGGRVEYNTFEIDGSDVLNTSINTSRGQGEPLMVYPSIDAIQEVKVITGDYSALYGKSASGSVVVTTKSGGPQYHGNLYGFLRNEMFNARNYFDQPGRTPLYRRQDYGGTVGGPLYIPRTYNTKKDKTFFFFSEELRMEKTPVDYNQAVPTAAERGEDTQNLGHGNFTAVGDFSDVCPTVEPGQAIVHVDITSYPDCPHTVDTTDPSKYDPQREVSVGYVGKALLDTHIIPEANSTTGCDTTNTTTLNRCYVASVSPPTYWREELFRIDHVLTPNEQVAFRYIHDAWDTTTLTPQWGVVQNSFPTVENRFIGPGLDLVSSVAQVLPHAILNRVALSYVVQQITLKPQTGPGVTSLTRPTVLDNPSAALGVPGYKGTSCGVATGPTSGGKAGTTAVECPIGYIFNNGYNGNRMPGLVFQGTNGAYGGHGFAVDTGYAPWNQANPTYSLRDDLSKTWGKHTLQVGFEATYAQQNELSAATGSNSGDLQGLLTFSNQQSRYTSGNAFADFLAGPSAVSNVASTSANLYTRTAIKSYTQDSGQKKYYNRYKAAEFYLQDDFRVNSRLTFNLGIRASLFGTWYNAEGTAYNWRPENFDKSVGGSVYVDSNNGYLVNQTTGAPIPLDVSTYPAITNGLFECGKNPVPKSCMTSSIFHPGPRIGLSWDPFGDGKTAIHAGYGMFWEHGTGYEANVGSLIGSAPLILSETQAAPSSYNTIGYSCQVDNANPSAGNPQCGSAAASISSATSPQTPTFPLNVTSIPTKATYPYTQQWSLSVQRQIAPRLIGQLAYVGTRGTHLTAVRDLNQLQPFSGQNPFAAGQPITSSVCRYGAHNGYFYPAAGTVASGATLTGPGIGPESPGWWNMVVACTGNPGYTTTDANGNVILLGTSADTRRPYPGFSNIISLDNIANSTYHALQGTLRETTGPVTIGLSYTYSHSIDDSSDRSSANFTNSLDIRTNHGSSDFDQRHLLNINYIYSLPLVRWLDAFADLVGRDEDDTSPSSGKGPGSAHAVRNLLLDNWQLSGITTYQTGSPFSVINGGSGNGIGSSDNAGVGDGLGVGSYPDVVASPRSIKPQVSSQASGSTIGPLLGNPGAFVAPRGLTFGNAGRNFMNNPSRINFNIALLKHFKAFQEKSDVEFRAEAFNVFNHTQFRIYDPSHAGNTGNNVINCYGDITTQYSAGASGCLAGNSFLHPVDAHDPRILQFAVKLGF